MCMCITQTVCAEKKRKEIYKKKKEKKNKYIYKERNKTTNTQKKIIKNQTKQLL